MAEAQPQQQQQQPAAGTGPPAPAAQPANGKAPIPSFLPLSFDPALLGPPGAGHQQLPPAHRGGYGQQGRQPLGPMHPNQQIMHGGFGGLPGPGGMMLTPQQQQHMMLMQQQAGQHGMPPDMAAAAGGFLPPHDPFDPLAAAAAGGMLASSAAAAASSKRRRKESSPVLDAEAQLLLLGFLSAAVGDSNTLNQCLISAVGLETQQEAARRAAAAAGLPASMPPPPKLGVLGSYKLAQKLAVELRGRPVLAHVFQLPQLSLDGARSMLALGGAVTLDDLAAHATSDLGGLLDSIANEDLPARRAKVEAQCELFADALRDVAEQLLQESGHIEKPAAAAPRAVTVYKPLPRCIIENKEPFAHKEWRRTPFDPRPYTPLTEYAITTNVPAEAKAVRWKLTTRRPDGAGDGFAEQHTGLSPEELKEREAHLVKQVVSRQALLPGVDVVEADTWGMDCYTRRNVFDAVLEADVFKHLRPEGQEEFEEPTAEEIDAAAAAAVAAAGGGGDGQAGTDGQQQQAPRPKRKKKKKKAFKEASSATAASASKGTGGGGGGARGGGGRFGGGSDGPLRPPPQAVLDRPEVPVICNTTPGTFLLLEMRVLCGCEPCSRQPDIEDRKFMPTKFEQHAGAGSSKKWRASIRIPPGGVDECPVDAQPLMIGKWMEELGIDSKVPKAGPAWLLPGHEQQQQEGEQQQQQQQQDGQQQGEQQVQQQPQSGELQPQKVEGQVMAAAPAADVAQPMEVDGQQQQLQHQLQQEGAAVKVEPADAAAAAAAAAPPSSSPQQPEVKAEVKPEAMQSVGQQQQQQQEAQPPVKVEEPAAVTAADQEQQQPEQLTPPQPQQPEQQQPEQQQQQQQSSPGQQAVPQQQLAQQSSPGQQSREASTDPGATATAAAGQAAPPGGAAADPADAAAAAVAGGSTEPAADAAPAGDGVAAADATAAGDAAAAAADGAADAAAADGTAAAAEGEASSSGEEVSCSDESSDEEGGGGGRVRRSARSRRKVVYADEAAVALEATTAAAREAAREAARDRLYGTRRIKYGEEEKEAVHAWIDAVFIPAVNRAGLDGWDMVKVATDIKLAAEAAGNELDASAASAILRQFERLPEGYNYFRLHPKGRGMLVARPGGLAPFTFVEEYLGQVHAGWRWFEIQDAIKKITQKELPDFYNITLERPKDDPDGYDVVFVDAAFMGSFASRMSHSCSPNCQAVVVSAGGRLTVALYTIRQVAPGEELTFDYASVTESEDEFKQAFCMCSSRQCRGSYLHYTGKAYMQVIEEQHTFLDRQAVLLRCSLEPLNDDDKAALHAAGLRGSALGRSDVAANPEVPDWLKKWAALTLQFVQKENELLPAALQALPPPLTVSEADSVAAAVGVELNRLQNICITLDKAKHCLNQPGQCKEPPLAMISDAEAAEHLWGGDRSVAKRAAAAAAAFSLDPQHAELLAGTRTPQQYAAAGQALAGVSAPLAAIATLLAQPAPDAATARSLLSQVVGHLRELDVAQGGGHTRTADVLALYAATKVWFTSTRDYISFSSHPLQLHEDMINMHGGFAGPGGQQQQQQPRRTSSQGQLPAAAAAAAAAGNSGFTPGGYSSYSGSIAEGWAPGGGPGPADWEGGPAAAAAGGGGEREGTSSGRGRGGRGGSRAGSAGSSYKRGGGADVSDDEYDPDNDSFSGSSPGSSEMDSDDDDSRGGRGRRRGGGGRGRGRGRGRGGGGGGSSANGGGPLHMRDISRKVLEKRYGPLYVWAQLSSWFKQTVYDPTASLSAERRGTLSLPDVEACYNTKEKYDARERARLINHISTQPERQWTASCWSFRNEAKVYGSPMFDALWFEVTQGTPRGPALEQLAESLRTAPVPSGGTGGLGGGRGGRGGRGRGGGRGLGGRGRGGRGRGRGRRRASDTQGSSSDDGGGGGMMELDDGEATAAAAAAGPGAGYRAQGYGYMPPPQQQQQWQQ